MSTYPGHRDRGGYGQSHGGFRGGRGGGGRGRGGGPPLPMVNREKSLDVTVVTNCFAIKKLPEKDYWLYDTFYPEVKNFARRQELFERLQTIVAPQIFKPLALYDGKALVYSSHPLGSRQQQDLALLVGWSNTPPQKEGLGVYRVNLKLTNSDPIRPKNLHALIKNQAVVNNAEAATALNLLNILIRQEPNKRYPHNAKAFFSKVGKKNLTGIELWRGFFQSVRPTRDNVLINIDTTMAAVIRAGPLLELCMEYLGLRNTRELMLDRRSIQFHKLEKFVKNIRIRTKTTPNVIKVIRGLVPNAGRYSFSKDGNNMTVEEYLASAYNLSLAHPNIVGVRLSKPDADREIVVPLEICTVQEGQFYKQRLPDSFTADAVKFACINPTERLNAIAGNASSDNFADSPVRHYHESEFIAESGMEIDTNPITIRGQILALPKVRFENGDLTPTNGSWNVVSRSLFKSSPMKCWGIVNFVERPGAMLDIVARSVKSCTSKLGLDVSDPCAIESGSGQAPEEALHRAMTVMRSKFPNTEKTNRPLLVVILPQNAAEVRQKVKHWGDITNGVLTQCLREGKLRKANDQYFNNIALKLNARLRGLNFVVESAAMNELRSRGRFIIMGADVAHPGPGIAKPSTASLVWSDDIYATHYNATVSIQPPRLEIIQDLHQMVYEAVLGFGRSNGSPQQIIFFRDGVSEGEFDKVAQHEIYDIKVAINTLWKEMGIKDPLPKLTFIIVGKRHHIAFFPQSNSPAWDGRGNCVAGFVSNQQDLSHPSTTDFYLQSHAAIQGTSRSGHYTVIHDEIFNSNCEKIQELAFSLCHVYAKATRSVSIPAPVYYADLACARSGFHYAPGSAGAFSETASAVSSDRQTFVLDEWKTNFKKVNRAMSSAMYFL